MEAKCLIIGKIPLDIKELFDYLPIVEGHMKRPDEQIKEVLSSYDKYLDLIKNKYWYFKINHTWKNSVISLSEILTSHE